MKLTKARIVIIVLSVLLTAGLAMELWHYRERKEWEAEREIFEEATTGELVWRDGLWQDSLIYLTDFSVDEENGRLYYVLRDRNRGFLVTGYDSAFIQVKKDGKWQALLDEEEIPIPEMGFRHLNRFEDIPASCNFPAEYQNSGEYRALYHISFSREHQQYVYAVGYFTIP